MRKKAQELSINFFVMLIITVVVFGFALAFAYKFFGKSTELQARIDQRTESELQTLISSQGMKVAVYPTQIEATPGKPQTLGVGILNVIGLKKNFTLSMACTKYINTSSASLSCPSNIKSVIQPSVEIENNKEGMVGGVISIDNSASAGTYIFDINVYYDQTTPYGGLQKVYVKL